MDNRYVSIHDAARILKVSKLTLRNWDKSGKLKAYRHPINNYRLYLLEDIEKIINGISMESPTEKEMEKPKSEEKKVYKLKVVQIRD